MEVKKIVEDLIDTFLKAGELSLSLREEGSYRKKSNQIIHLLVMVILK